MSDSYSINTIQDLVNVISVLDEKGRANLTKDLADFIKINGEVADELKSKKILGLFTPKLGVKNFVWVNDDKGEQTIEVSSRLENLLSE